MKTEFVYLNENGDWPVEIHCLKSQDLGKDVEYHYVDPEDGEEWDENQLSATERGLFMRVLTAPGRDVVISLDYRLMDFQLAVQLAGLHSFRPLDPHLFTGAYANERLLRKPMVALQRFALSQDDFVVFRDRV